MSSARTDSVDRFSVSGVCVCVCVCVSVSRAVRASVCGSLSNRELGAYPSLLIRCEGCSLIIDHNEAGFFSASVLFTGPCCVAVPVNPLNWK